MSKKRREITLIKYASPDALSMISDGCIAIVDLKNSLKEAGDKALKVTLIIEEI